MQRWKLTIEYDGRPFVGWQRQDNGPSVQEALETAIFRFCGEAVRVQAAGRTDAGVHALGQVAHADIARPSDAKAVVNALNAHLQPQPIAVLRAEPVAANFDARFSCTGRRYHYRIVNRRAPVTLEAGLAWQIGTALDADAMADAAKHLIGMHDFTSFRAAACQAQSPVKTLDSLCVRRRGAVIAIDAAARSFLHHQVRNIVGTLVLVGKGKWTPEDVARVRDRCDRAAAGPTAPAEGLYFVKAVYPGGGEDHDDMPELH